MRKQGGRDIAPVFYIYTFSGKMFRKILDGSMVFWQFVFNWFRVLKRDGLKKNRKALDALQGVERYILTQSRAWRNWQTRQT